MRIDSDSVELPKELRNTEPTLLIESVVMTEVYGGSKPPLILLSAELYF